MHDPSPQEIKYHVRIEDTDTHTGTQYIYTVVSLSMVIVIDGQKEKMETFAGISKIIYKN